ncbi:sulfite exporter TauE/SafE family protein [Pseudochryseolinea flava]|uniref:sulfite exporter TauE/SafE family protein n=1 Tax=Pseudochryseolinea flava TaxID=2059302 RepID=UPI001FEA4941|nr:sulfite exporter TauE/SafE family protein [Pseudochryseolinea flava]
MSKNLLQEDTIEVQEREEVAPVEEAEVSSESSQWKLLYTIAIVVAVLSLVFLGTFYYENIVTISNDAFGDLSSDFYFFLLAGFVAQMIDGALGMAYGVSATTFLLTVGVPLSAASASIHASEVFTSGASGLMHLKFRNVNKKLLKTLLLPGVIGAALGAYVLSSLEAYDYILKPIVGFYTLYLGIVIIQKAIVGIKRRIKSNRIPGLAAFGGFMDSVGGGGWGPIVSSTLIAGGRHPRYTIGSVNLAEFFVALASSFTFFLVLGIEHWQIIAGLILGGLVAAPIAAYLSSRISTKRLMLVVGVVVILVSIRIVYKGLPPLIDKIQSLFATLS